MVVDETRVVVGVTFVGPDVASCFTPRRSRSSARFRSTGSGTRCPTYPDGERDLAAAARGLRPPGRRRSAEQAGVDPEQRGGRKRPGEVQRVEPGGRGQPRGQGRVVQMPAAACAQTAGTDDSTSSPDFPWATDSTSPVPRKPSTGAPLAADSRATTPKVSGRTARSSRGDASSTASAVRDSAPTNRTSRATPSRSRSCGAPPRSRRRRAWTPRRSPAPRMPPRLQFGNIRTACSWFFSGCTGPTTTRIGRPAGTPSRARRAVAPARSGRNRSTSTPGGITQVRSAGAATTSTRAAASAAERRSRHPPGRRGIARRPGGVPARAPGRAPGSRSSWRPGCESSARRAGRAPARQAARPARSASSGRGSGHTCAAGQGGQPARRSRR